MPLTNTQPQSSVNSSSIPVARTTVPGLLTTTTTNTIPVEKTVYRSTYSYSNSPISSPRVISSHNEYKYNTSTTTSNTLPSKTVGLHNFGHSDGFFYDTLLPTQTTSNNVFEITPEQEELNKITYHPKLEIYSTASFVIIMMDLPGVPKENLKVELEKGLLKIFGEKNKTELEELKTPNDFHTKIIERLNGYYFCKVFKIPSAFWEGQNISCKLNNGELVIKILASEVNDTKKVINVE